MASLVCRIDIRRQLFPELLNLVDTEMRKLFEAHTADIIFRHEVQHAKSVVIWTSQDLLPLFQCTVGNDTHVLIDSQRPLEAHVVVDRTLAEA